METMWSGHALQRLAQVLPLELQMDRVSLDFNKEIQRLAEFLGQKAHETSTVGVMVIESLMRCVICMQISEEWKRFRDSLKKPSKYQEDCQQPKPVLLDTGEMFKPYAWAVRPLHHSPYSLTIKYLFYLLRTQISICHCRKKQDEYR